MSQTAVLRLEELRRYIKSINLGYHPAWRLAKRANQLAKIFLLSGILCAKQTLTGRGLWSVPRFWRLI